jgi:hypothetical protein
MDPGACIIKLLRLQRKKLMCSFKPIKAIDYYQDTRLVTQYGIYYVRKEIYDTGPRWPLSL